MITFTNTKHTIKKLQKGDSIRIKSYRTPIKKAQYIGNTGRILYISSVNGEIVYATNADGETYYWFRDEIEFIKC